VNLRAPLRAIHLAGGAVNNVEFDGGRRESADGYVFALPHEALADLLTEEIKRLEPSLANLGNIRVAPITGVHFWFDREVMREPFVTLLETTTQWIFNKTTRCMEPQTGLLEKKGSIYSWSSARLRSTAEAPAGNH